MSSPSHDGPNVVRKGVDSLRRSAPSVAFNVDFLNTCLQTAATTWEQKMDNSGQLESRRKAAVSKDETRVQPVAVDDKKEESDDDYNDWIYTYDAQDVYWDYVEAFIRNTIKKYPELERAYHTDNGWYSVDRTVFMSVDFFLASLYRRFHSDSDGGLTNLILEYIFEFDSDPEFVCLRESSKLEPVLPLSVANASLLEQMRARPLAPFIATFFHDKLTALRPVSRTRPSPSSSSSPPKRICIEVGSDSSSELCDQVDSTYPNNPNNPNYPNNPNNPHNPSNPNNPNCFSLTKPLCHLSICRAPSKREKMIS